MSDIEVRRRIVQPRFPRNLNKASRCVSKAALCSRSRALGICPLGIRTHIHRFSKSVAKVHLQTVGHGVTQDELTSVIVADPYGGPRHQRRELRIPEGNRGQSEAGRRPPAVSQLRGEQAQAERCAYLSSRAVGPAETGRACSVPPSTSVDVLGCAEPSGSCGGEYILKVGNGWNHRSFVFAMCQGELRHQCGGREVIHPRLRVNKIRRGC